mmetsp:Transcript_36694/g.87622  ORF Transcript_36694/g.87622 Transcript_36694/m.87622 type:complete len:298 (-) Transcript_36694:765-1658(-)
MVTLASTCTADPRGRVISDFDGSSPTETSSLTGGLHIREANDLCSSMISLRQREGILTLPVRLIFSDPSASSTASDSHWRAVLETSSAAMSVTFPSSSKRSILGMTTGIFTDTPDDILTVGMGEPSKPPTSPLRFERTMVDEVSLATAIRSTTSSAQTCTPLSWPTRRMIESSSSSSSSISMSRSADWSALPMLDECDRPSGLRLQLPDSLDLCVSSRLLCATSDWQRSEYELPQLRSDLKVSEDILGPLTRMIRRLTSLLRHISVAGLGDGPRYRKRIRTLPPFDSWSPMSCVAAT